MARLAGVFVLVAALAVMISSRSTTIANEDEAAAIATSPASVGSAIQDQDEEERPEDPFRRAQRRASDLVTKGLGALAEAQNADGSIGGLESERVRIAVTALALLALVADGNFETRGLHADVVRRATRFLMACAGTKGDRKGYFATVGDVESRMHGQGFATLALCQVYGHHGVGRRHSGTSDDLRQVISDAVDLIIRSQNSAGGWFYDPFASVEDEGSITVTMIQALRAARNVGIAVPPRVIERALDYVKASQNEDGSIRYSLRNQREGSFELTAAGLGVLAYGGEYSSRTVRAARDWLWSRGDVFSGNLLAYPLYGYFYALQALWFDYDADRISAWYPRFLRWCEENWNEKDRRYELTGGSRLKENEYGPAYATAIVTLSLQIPHWSLPIFDR